MDSLVTRKQMASLLGMSTRTLDRHDPPRAISRGKLVRFNAEKVLEFMGRPKPQPKPKPKPKRKAKR